MKERKGSKKGKKKRAQLIKCALHKEDDLSVVSLYPHQGWGSGKHLKTGEILKLVDQPD